jgi:hypothetical protein
MQRAYSSIEAFASHWRALQADDGAHTLGAVESELLRAMDAVIKVLDPAERVMLESAGGSASTDGAPAAANALARRRQRALAKLAPVLTAAGWLQ